MSKFLLKMLMPAIMQVIESLMSPENIKTYGDKLFDFIEDAVTSSETDIDDTVVLPLIKAIRVAFNIPDND